MNKNRFFLTTVLALMVLCQLPAMARCHHFDHIYNKYRDDDALQRKLGEITQRQFDSRRGFYGTVGDGCVIKNCQILKDVNCYLPWCVTCPMVEPKPASRRLRVWC